MAFQYWQPAAAERRRTRFVSLEMAYHGDTMGSVSVGGIDLFHSLYHPLLFDTLRPGPGDRADMERMLAEHGGGVAAVIMEPLMQAAAGMLTPARLPARGARAVRPPRRAADPRRGGHRLRPHRGRCSRATTRASPQICSAQGPHRRVPAARRHARQRGHLRGLPRRAEEFRAFFHGHAYTGNPLACAAASHPRRVPREGTIERLQPKIQLLEELLEADRRAPRRARGAPLGLRGGNRTGGAPLPRGSATR